MDNPLVFTLAFSVGAILLAIPVGLYKERWGVYLLQAGIILFVGWIIVTMVLIIAMTGAAK